MEGGGGGTEPWLQSGRKRHLYGNGHDLIPRVLVEEADGSGEVLQRARVCLVRSDAIQHLVVHHVDVARLGVESSVRKPQVRESRWSALSLRCF